MPSIDTERDYENNIITKIQNRYLNTNTIEKVKFDDGYRCKVEMFEKSIGNTNGLVLDLGANTCGEAEYLVNKGYNVVAGDINEFALSLSLKRTKLYGYKGPKYFAFDAHSIPFPAETFDCVIASESLHHFEDLGKVLNEINRVLKVGGQLIALEPYSFNPYRRLAEIFYFLFTGSIERSFSRRGISKMLDKHNFTRHKIQMVVLPPSKWKLKYTSKINSLKKILYFQIAKVFPKLLGLLLIQSTKRGDFKASGLESLKLICPISGNELIKVRNGYTSVSKESPFFYEIKLGIPVLVRQDAIKLTMNEWHEKTKTG